MSVSAPLIIHLSLVIGGDVIDGRGGKLGRVDDLIVRLGEGEYPPVSGVLATVAKRQVFIPANFVSEIQHRRVALNSVRLDLRPFGRRPQEVLLKKDVLDRQLINIDGARLVRANEIELARLEWYHVVGVDVSLRGIARRLLPRGLAGRVRPSTFLDWASVEPFTGHVPTVRLRVPHPKLARLHPAQLADLVEAASHREGEEIIEAVGGNPELEADVFEELESSHQLEFIEDRSNAEIAKVIGRMEPDDGVDLLNELPEERRDEITRLLPPAQRRRIRTLMGYDPSQAGGLMSPDFVCLYDNATVGEALARVQAATATPIDTLAWIFAMDANRVLTGAIPLVDVVRSKDPQQKITELAEEPRPVKTDSPVETIAGLMTDYDLTVVPVIDDHDCLVGVVTVDDILDIVLPKSWRRQYGVFGEE